MNPVHPTTTLQLVEHLERELSQREYSERRLRQELQVARTTVAERDEQIVDLTSQYERSIAQLQAAQENEMAGLARRIQQLEENELPATVSTLKNSLHTIERLRQEINIEQLTTSKLEAKYKAAVAEASRQIDIKDKRIKDLELEMQHLVAVASKFVKQEVLHQSDDAQHNARASPTQTPGSQATYRSLSPAQTRPAIASKAHVPPPTSSSNTQLRESSLVALAKLLESPHNSNNTPSADNLYSQTAAPLSQPHTSFLTTPQRPGQA